MKKTTGLLILVIWFHFGFAQIGGPSTGVVGQSDSFTYHDMTTYPTFSWTVTGTGTGTVTSSTRVGLNYIGVIYWTGLGPCVVKFIGNGNILGQMNVTVSCPTVTTPNATFSYPNGTTACGSVPINYSGSPPGGTTWYWQTTTTGTSQANSSNSFIATNTASSQAYYLRAYSSGCWSSSISTSSVAALAMPQDPTPLATLTVTSNTCGPKTITVSGTVPNGETWNWEGTNSSGTTINTSSTYLAYTSGTYYLRALKATNGCWGNSASKAVTIGDPLQPTSPTTTTYACGPQTLTRSAPPGGETWYWQGTNSNGTSTTSSAVTYPAPASGTYYLRSQNSSGCWSQSLASIVVTVNNIPAAPASFSSSTNTCDVKTLTRGNPSDGTTWYWQGTNASGQDQSIGAAATTYIASVSGSNMYYLRALSTSGCWSPATGVSVTVNLIPAPPSNAASTINTCDAKTLTKGTPPSGVGWYWQGTNASGQDYTSQVATAPTYVVTTNNTYYLAAYSTAGCWSATSTPLVVTTYPADLTISSYDPVNTVVQATHSIRLLPGFASTGGTFNAKIAFTAECNDYVNWTEQIGYDQNQQPVARSRTYFDGLGNTLQSQSMDYLSGKVWASQPLYDNLNQASASTLPAPIIESDFLLKKNFVQNAAGQWYSAADFDGPIGSGPGELSNPNAVGNQLGTLGSYYSSQNNLETQTPTTNFPYSRSYTPPGPDPITSTTAGPGDQHKMGSTHEVKSDRYLITAGDLDTYTLLKHYFASSTLNSPDLVNVGKPVSNVPNQFLSSGAVTVSTSAPYVVVTSNTNSGTPGTLPIVGNITVTPGSWYTFKVKGFKASAQSANLAVTTSTGTNIVWPGPALPTCGIPSQVWVYVTFQVPAGVTSIRVGVLWSQPAINDAFYLSDAVLQLEAPPPVTGYKYINTDPDGKKVASFVDADGHTVATALATGNPGSFTYDQWSYNYYNTAGQLVATIAPNGVIINNPSLPNFVTYYRYDQLGRLIETTSPDEGTSQ